MVSNIRIDYDGRSIYVDARVDREGAKRLVWLLEACTNYLEEDSTQKPVKE